MDKSIDAALVWLRRDLRVHDHAALYHALRAARRVWCAFVFDRAILDALPRADRRVEFIRDSLVGVDTELRALAASHGVEGASLIVRHDDARIAIPALARALRVQAVYVNHDDEPFALARDAHVRGVLAGDGIAMHSSKDHVIFERSEVLTGSGTPYTVFTPYRKAWMAKVDAFFLSSYPVARHAAALAPTPVLSAVEGPKGAAQQGVPTLAAIGFDATNLHELRVRAGPAGAREMLDEFLERIDHYHEAREFPAVKGPSYLGVHLRFGTVSIRDCARAAWQRMQAGGAGPTPGRPKADPPPRGAASEASVGARSSRGAEVWLSELTWRDFYHQLMHHHPHVIGHAFRREYDAMKWERGKTADAAFAAWCEGRTGYPLVDAAMHQINSSGYMHNRLRMIVASFLTKDLGLDWRRGEAYFATHLNDFDLAANNGGWQWAASTGCDAQPWFRIFNPVTQSEKFDPDGRFIRRYLPVLANLPHKLIHAPWKASPLELEASGVRLGENYPRPIVEHDVARTKTLARYGAVKRPA